MAILTVGFTGHPIKKALSEVELKKLLIRARGSVMWNLAHVESRLAPKERPCSQMSRHLRELLDEINSALADLWGQEKLSEEA